MSTTNSTELTFGEELRRARSGRLSPASPYGVPVSIGVSLIEAERKRQVADTCDAIEGEGFTAEHDAGHNLGELAVAAWCYLGDHVDDGCATDHHEPPAEWPWEDLAWKPTPGDPVRQLVKAGALIAAEIDRLLALSAECRGPVGNPGRPE